MMNSMYTCYVVQDRVLAAKAMVSRLKSSKRADIVSNMEKLCLAYLQLANLNVEQYKRETSRSIK